MDTLQDLPVFRPYLGPEIQAAVAEALQIGYLGLGPTTAAFEERLGSWLGLPADRTVIATNSCTNALHLAALVAGLGPGDEVICPSFTYVAATQAMTMTGAEVVFADIAPDTLSVDAASVAALIGPRTRALMICHYDGVVGDRDGIYALAREHGLRVIEDAAQALGSVLSSGAQVGAEGDLVCFSFGPVKTLTTLEGGALVLPSSSAVLARQFRMLGADMDLDARAKNDRFWVYDVVRQGFRHHLGAVPAAVGLAGLTLLDGFLADRRTACADYDARLAGLPGITSMGWDWASMGPFIYVARVEPSLRDGLLLHLKRSGVGANVHWGQGVHEFSFFAGCRRADLPVTEAVCQELVTLPLWSRTPVEVRERVVDAVAAFLR
jgi:dTDP-4-amino-4,6-dideoxygalactose transaminase